MFVSSIVRYGGGERWMLDAAAGLKARGYDIVLVSRPGSVIGRKASEAGINHVPIEMRGDLDLLAISKLSRLIRSFNPDVVCPNLDREIRLCGLSIFSAGKLAAGRVRRGEGKTRLIPRRGSEFPLKNKFHYRFFYTRMVHTVIANSRATKETMLSNTPWFPQEKAVVIYNGIDTKVYEQLRGSRRNVREKLRECLGLLGHTPLVTLVGELNERKGHRYVVEAARAILGTFPDTRFLFVGEGEARAEIERSLNEKGFKSHFFLLGFREDIPEILTASDILILPSRVEGFGYVLVEAMAAGLPVVATRASSITEIVEDGKTGFLHELGDSAGIAEAICRLLADRGLADEMGKAGNERVEERFRVERMIDRLEEVFFGTARA